VTYKVFPPDHPNLQPVPKGYKFDEDWAYEWLVLGHKRRLLVPKLTESDGASVPRILWTITGITPDGLVRAAAAVHDMLYRFGGRLPPGWLLEIKGDEWVTLVDMQVYTRRDADRLFARIMRDAGVPKWKRRLAFLGVRLGGYWSWVEGPP
jgi:hypothetical protein